MRTPLGKIREGGARRRPAVGAGRAWGWGLGWGGLGWLGLGWVPGLAGATLADLAVVRERVEAEWLARADAGAAAGWRDQLGADGRWPDLDYTSASTTHWPLPAHCERAGALAAAYRAEGSALRGDPGTRAAVGRAWEHWFERDYTNANWWYNEIGVPRALAPGLLLLREELTGRERTAGLRILERARIKGESQNLVWLAEINALRGLLVDDPTLVETAYGRIAAEIKVVDYDGEGLQADGSFLQHRRCLYNHGYGSSFVLDAARLARLLGGTGLAISPERTALVTGLVLDGTQWMTRGSFRDWSARGREFTRPDAASATYLATAAADLLEAGAARPEELRALRDRLRGAPEGRPLEGHRHFWRADFQTHHRAGYYFSLRMYSRRLANTDFNGPENLLGHHLADGVTVWVRRGNEYDGLFPVWDWQRLPGATARQSPALVPGQPRRDRGSRDFAGGVSDGHYGAAGFDFERDGLAVRKAWFCFDEGVLALGAGLTDTSGAPVATTLNQVRRFGAVLPVAGGVWHDSTLYVGLAGPPLLQESRLATGSWQRINQQQSAAAVSVQVFTAWLDHGTSPVGQSYAYWVQPGVALAEASTAAAQVPVRLAANTPAGQAAWHRSGDLAAAIFHEAGRLEMDSGQTLSCDRPAAVLLRRRDGRWRIHAASPEQAYGLARIRWQGREYHAHWPAGQSAGASVEALPLVLENPHRGADGRWRATFRRPSVGPAPTYVVEWSQTLAPGSWMSAGLGASILSDDGRVQTVEWIAPAGSGPRFLRVRVP